MILPEPPPLPDYRNPEGEAPRLTPPPIDAGVGTNPDDTVHIPINIPKLPVTGCLTLRFISYV
jgi:hypothetical protein